MTFYVIAHNKNYRKIMSQHVARTGQKRGAFRVLVGDLKEINHLEDLDVGGRIILKWVLKKLVERARDKHK
jgi:hypothetical protein